MNKTQTTVTTVKHSKLAERIANIAADMFAAQDRLNTAGAQYKIDSDDDALLTKMSVEFRRYKRYEEQLRKAVDKWEAIQPRKVTR